MSYENLSFLLSMSVLVCHSLVEYSNELINFKQKWTGNNIIKNNNKHKTYISGAYNVMSSYKYSVEV